MADDTSTAKREPPEIIFVPPALQRATRRTFVRLLVIGLVSGALALGVFLWLGLPVSLPLILGIPGACVAVSMIAALGLMWENSQNRKAWHRLQAERAENPPEAVRDETLQALAQLWSGSGLRIEAVRDVLARLQPDARARIVLLGREQPPEVGDLRFEPEIVAPGETVGRLAIWLVLLCVTWCALVVVARVPLRLAVILSLLWLPALVAGSLWIWKGVLRPTYVRMAPGIIQVLEFRYRRPKPTIRSYPMTAGTVIVLGGILRVPTMWLLRGEQRDTIRFAYAQRSDERMERAWQAMLSTAPTPPLSDEELVG